MKYDNRGNFNGEKMINLAGFLYLLALLPRNICNAQRREQITLINFFPVIVEIVDCIHIL
jgi:hypothetical protein